MSYYNAPGGYVPPPPPPPTRGRSPWLWVGLGCGVLVLLVIGLFIAGGALVANRMQHAMNKPLSPQQAIQPMKDAHIPVYPNATLNIPATKAARGAMDAMSGIIGKKTLTISTTVFMTADPSLKVASWYDTELKKVGWSEATSRSPIRSGGNITSQTQYQKASDQLILQNGSDAKTSKTSITIILMSGLRGQSR